MSSTAADPATALVAPVKRPEPVLDAAKLATAVSGAVSGVGGLLVVAGYASTQDVTSWAVASGAAVVGVGALLGVVMPVITALRARDQVTPLRDPRDAAGQPLVVEGTVTGPVRDRLLKSNAGGPVDIAALTVEYFGDQGRGGGAVTVVQHTLTDDTGQPGSGWVSAMARSPRWTAFARTA